MTLEQIINHSQTYATYASKTLHDSCNYITDICVSTEIALSRIGGEILSSQLMSVEEATSRLLVPPGQTNSWVESSKLSTTANSRFIVRWERKDAGRALSATDKAGP